MERWVYVANRGGVYGVIVIIGCSRRMRVCGETVRFVFFFNETATTEIYTEWFVGSVRGV